MSPVCQILRFRFCRKDRATPRKPGVSAGLPEQEATWGSFPTKGRIFQLLRAVGIVLLLGPGYGALSGSAHGEDVVRIRGSRNQGELRLTGEVLEYSGQELRIRRVSGREETYEAERVLEIQGAWSEVHRQGELLLAERRAAEALPLLQEAAQAERREWVHRRIMAHQVLACRQIGDLERAVFVFAELLRSDPLTPHFAVIPLCWPSPLPSATREAQAVNWLNQSSSAIRLIGASWLLTSTQRANAIRALRGLAEDTDARVAFLARCQLWRTELAAVTERDMTRWQEWIQRMPADLRAGPLLLFAQGLARTGKPREAAVEFLRLPILYSEQSDLAAEGLWNAGQQLEAIGEAEEARTLYRELIANFPDHLQVARAEQRLGEPVSAP